MNRVAIYVYYDKEGVVHADALWQLRELKKCVDYLYVVVNGKLVDDMQIKQVADEVVYRENTGFDAAAYKTILTDSRREQIIENSDELVFCNNSVYGPFNTFVPIFEKMESSDADFWGMAYLEYGFFRCIESFFMVFRKRILENGDLQKYFQDNIAYDTDDFTSICLAFEHGLFEYLLEKGYKFDAYTNSKHWIHRDVLEIIKLEGLPVLKKKAFSKKYFEKERVLDTVRYIGENFDYDVNCILDKENVREEYERRLKEVEEPNYQVREIPMPKSREVIQEYLRKNRNVYIYGYGLFGRYMLEYLVEDRANVKGFVISDGQNIKGENLYGLPVYNVSQLIGKDVEILVALNEENSVSVMSGLTGFEKVFYIWDTSISR